MKRVETEKEINQLRETEKTIQFQRARANWMKDGDKSTKFFHSYASARHRKNQVKGLLKADDSQETRAKAIHNLFINHFAKLFKALDIMIHDELFFGMHGRVTELMNHELSKPFMSEEVKQSLFAMHLSKAPGKDGFPAVFFNPIEIWWVIQ